MVLGVVQRAAKENSQEMKVCLPLETRTGSRSICQREQPICLKPQVMRRP